MAAPQHGNDAVISSAQLVQYDDDDENDDKIDSSHSDHLAHVREATGEDATRELVERSAAHVDGQEGMDGAEVDAGSDRVAEGGRDYEDAIDDEVREDVYLETTVRETMVIQQTHVGTEGADLAAEAMRVFCSFDTATEGVNVQDMITSSTPGAVGSGNYYSEEDLHERGMEEAALHERVQADETAAYLPEETGRSEEHSSFSSMQQLQLRAQILVYGDLIKGVLPEESLMSSAFSDANEVSGQESDRSPGRWDWERTWQLAVEKEAERQEAQEAERQAEGERTNAKGDVTMTEGNAVNAGAENLEPGTPSTSPIRVAEDPVREEVVPTAMTGAAGDVNLSAADLDAQPTDVDGVSVLTVNLDAVVDNIVASSIDGSGLKESRVESQPARSPSLDPWLKPHTSQVSPIPGSMPFVNSPAQTPAWQAPKWVAPAQTVPGSEAAGSQAANTPSVSAQPDVVGGAAAGPSIVPETVVGSEEGSRKRKGKAREKKTVQAPKWVAPAPTVPGSEAAGSQAANTPSISAQPDVVGGAAAGPSIVPETVVGSEEGSRKRKGKAREKKTPAPKVAATTPRRSRAKNASQGVSDANLRAVVVPSRLIYESSEAAVILKGGSQASPYAGKKKEPPGRPNLHAETQNWLEQAKVSFEEAASAANSASEQLHLVKSLTNMPNQAPGREGQNASAAAAVNAAASVAKAAAEAAKVAYEAALQATLIVSDGIDPGLGKIGVGNIQGDKDGGLGGRRSAIAAAKEEARKRATGTTPSPKTTPQGTDAVLRAARLMAEAASQAGAVLAKGNSAVPFTVPQSPVLKVELKRSAGRGRPRKEETIVKSPETVKPTVEVSLNTAKDVKGSMKKGARKKGKDVLELGTNKTPAQKPNDGEPKMSPEKAPRRQLDEVMASASNATDAPEVLQQDQIAEGSLVEVMSDEEGLRGGWFSAKVLQLKAGDAYVQYDEILTDDGKTQLKEWFPVEGPLEGTERGRPRIRVISPNNVAREEGRRKRRRTAIGQKNWSVGDRVDAYVQDGWWEGVVKSVDEDDESKITVNFPGEGDTSVVKSWNLRPSYVWKAGRWEQWSGDGLPHVKLDESQPSKKQKIGESPKVQARKSGRSSTPVGKGVDEATEGSKSKKPNSVASNPISPALTTRSSPRQKIAPKKKEGPILANPATEVSTPTQVSTPVTTRTRSIAEDAVNPVKEPRKKSVPASGLASHSKSPLSPDVEKSENQLEVASLAKSHKLTENSEALPSPVNRVPATRKKGKTLAVPATRRSARV